MPFEATFLEASDQSLLVSFGESIETESYSRVLNLFRLLRDRSARGVVNLHPAYSSLLIRFDPLAVSHGELKAEIASRLSPFVEQQQGEPPQEISIPVCYHPEFGPDLASLASLHALSVEDAIDLHASTVYTVYFLGFVPGFAYLGMVPEQLATPRLPAPRQQVPAGSVGIADRQTGVYPFSTPGGWRLIGRTALTLFEPKRPGMSLLQPGDRVKFHPVSLDEFQMTLG